MLKTKFKITMEVEVKDVGGIKADSETLSGTIQECLKDFAILDIRKIQVSRIGRGCIAPKVIHHDKK